MAIINTAQLLEEFFSRYDENTRKRIMGMIARPELYQYEREIGKQLVDMNTDELFELLLRFYSRRGDNNFALKISTYSTVSTYMRSIFDYYIDQYNPVSRQNPWRSTELKSTNVIEKLADINTKLSWQQFEAVITKLYHQYSQENAEYLECMMRLYYEGFRSAEDIVNLKQDMINFSTKEVRIYSRTLHLSERTIQLLNRIHRRTSVFNNENREYAYVSWHNSYFKFIVRPKNADKYRNSSKYDEKYLGRKLNAKLAKEVRSIYSIDASSRTIFYLGLFDLFIEKYGKDLGRKIIYSNNVKEYNNILLSFAEEYNLNINNVMYLKRHFMLYI
ncbi:MAG: hypothetical protein IJ168_06370 [Eubacterium sp.]|nr:hypothetical protein [Eubacterium sp.]